MLLIVGEPIVAYQRVADTDPEASFNGPWASGSPAICAYVAGRLGLPVSFVGAVGDDEHGGVMRTGLAAGGVDVTGLAVRDDAPTAWARVTYRGAERTFDFHVADSAAVTLGAEDLGDLPEKTDWLHVSGSALIFGGSLPDTVFEALERARRAGATISVDPNVRPESLEPGLLARLRSALEVADYVLPSAGELEALDVDVEGLVARGTSVCRTDGAVGAQVLTPGSPPIDVPAVPVDAVDPDGAGDSFAAGFIRGIVLGNDVVSAARLGARVAAAAVGVPGPMTVVLDEFRTPA